MRPGTLAAVLGGRCPICHQGRVFAGRLRMNRSCPDCGLFFEREPGYFVGAMYVSYALALPACGTAVLLLHLALPSLRLGWLLAIATVLLVPLVPLLFRASRVIWLHIDHLLDPRG